MGADLSPVLVGPEGFSHLLWRESFGRVDNGVTTVKCPLGIGCKPKVTGQDGR